MDVYTYGEMIVLTDVTATPEPITLTEVKAGLNMPLSITVHDLELTRLITSCRMAAESARQVNLIPERGVKVAWQQFNGDAALPYCPLKSGTSVTVTDLKDVAIDESQYTLTNLEGFCLFEGYFPNGVKLSYTAKSATITAQVKDALIRSVGACFEQKVKISDVVNEQFRGIYFK